MLDRLCYVSELSDIYVVKQLPAADESDEWDCEWAWLNLKSEVELRDAESLRSTEQAAQLGDDSLWVVLLWTTSSFDPLLI